MKKNKEEQERIRLIRRIHLNKLADKINIGDINDVPKRKSCIEIFAEHECWRCKKVIIHKDDLCCECRQFMIETRKHKPKEPRIVLENVNDVFLMIKNYVLKKSMYEPFTKEFILLFNSKYIYDHTFTDGLTTLIEQGYLLRTVLFNIPAFQLTSEGIKKLEEIGDPK
jgi:hypothetical protein